jgi:transcription elongation factor GreB
VATGLITREGFERLRNELNELWRVQRPEIVRALSAAAAEGDRSENAEYIYRKKQLRELDRRVRYLGKRLPDLKVVDQQPADTNRIYFGATVELENLDTGDRVRYRIVGPDETDAPTGQISVDSPMARALIKRQVDDEFTVQLPSGPADFRILDVRYGD